MGEDRSGPVFVIIAGRVNEDMGWIMRKTTHGAGIGMPAMSLCVRAIMGGVGPQVQLCSNEVLQIARSSKIPTKVLSMMSEASCTTDSMRLS